MKVLYIVLVLCTVAVVGTAIALYLRVRGHLRAPAHDDAAKKDAEEHTLHS